MSKNSIEWMNLRSSHLCPVYGWIQIHVKPAIPFGLHWPALRHGFCAHGSPNINITICYKRWWLVKKR
jgi:hypothetical protein